MSTSLAHLHFFSALRPLSSTLTHGASLNSSILSSAPPSSGCPRSGAPRGRAWHGWAGQGQGQADRDRDRQGRGGVTGPDSPSVQCLATPHVTTVPVLLLCSVHQFVSHLCTLILVNSSISRARRESAGKANCIYFFYLQPIKV